MDPLSPATLECDCSVGSSVRVRLWRHTAARASAERIAAHPSVELSWVEAGEVRYEIGARGFTLRSGDAIVIPHGAEHRTTFLSGARGGALHLDPVMVAEI